MFIHQFLSQSMKSSRELVAIHAAGSVGRYWPSSDRSITVGFVSVSSIGLTGSDGRELHDTRATKLKATTKTTRDLLRMVLPFVRPIERQDRCVLRNDLILVLRGQARIGLWNKRIGMLPVCPKHSIRFLNDRISVNFKP